MLFLRAAWHWILSRSEIIKNGSLLGFMVGVMALISTSRSSGYDWFVSFYPQASLFDKNSEFVYPVHLFFLLKPFTLFNQWISFLLYGFLSILVIILSCRMTNAKLLLVLFTYPTIWVLWNGQVDIWVALGTALAVYSLDRKNPHLVGAAATLLAIKPHIAGILAIALLFWSRDWRSLIIPGITFVLTILVWGLGWPVTWVNNIQADPGFFLGQTMNISLFPWGILAFLLLLLPLSRLERIGVILSATILSMPYSAGYSTLPLLVLPLPWWVYASTYITVLTAPGGYWTMVFVPLGTLVWVGFSAFRRWRLSDSQGITREVQ